MCEDETEIGSIEQALDMVAKSGGVGLADYINMELFKGKTAGPDKTGIRVQYSFDEFVDAANMYLRTAYREPMTQEQRGELYKLLGIFTGFAMRYFR